MPFHPSKRLVSLALAIAVLTAGTIATVRTVRASDHQDTPEVELNQRMDITDVYAFPGATSDRITLVLSTASPITPANASSTFFDPNLLYQIKVDTNTVRDGIEDLVFQITFSGSSSTQQVTVRGPIAPASTGTANTLVTTGQTVSGSLGTTLGSATGMQVFAGLRADPFFIDLSQFFAILNDRRPSTGPAATPTAPAGSWRPLCDGTNPTTCAKDFLKDINALAIVIELPVAQLKASGKFGVWGTISR